MTKKKEKKVDESPTVAPSNAITRAQDELSDLQGRTTDLIKFKHSKKYEALSTIHQRFLRIQLLAMKNYADVLAQRIHIW